MRNISILMTAILAATATLSRAAVHDWDDPTYSVGPVTPSQGPWSSGSSNFVIEASEGISGGNALGVLHVYPDAWSAMSNPQTFRWTENEPLTFSMELKFVNGALSTSNGPVMFATLSPVVGGFPNRLVYEWNVTSNVWNMGFNVMTNDPYLSGGFTNGPITAVNTTSDWVRWESSMSKTPGGLFEFVSSNAFYSLGPNGTDTPVLIQAMTFTATNAVFFGNENLTFSLGGGNPIDFPHNVTPYIDNIVVSEPNVIASAFTALVNAVVIETEHTAISEETELRSTADLPAGQWPVSTGMIVEPGLTTVRYVDPDSSAAQNNYAIATPDVITFFFDDFEGPDMGWATTGAGPTVWEQGTPNYNEPLFDVYITNAASGTDCWGTGLDVDYEPGTDITLTSPAISLTNATSATVEWMERRDIDNTASTDAGLVNIIDVDLATTNQVHVSTGPNADWEQISAPVPASALGHSIKVQFHFLDDGADSPKWAGWYVDDVRVRD